MPDDRHKLTTNNNEYQYRQQRKCVAYARKYSNLTQYELAEKASVAQSSLATLESER